MSIDSVQLVASQLEAAHRQLTASIDGVTDAELHSVPAEGEWSVAQVCAHVVEMQVLWMAKIADMARVPELARTEDDQKAREAAITDHAADPLPTIETRLQEANHQALDLLRGMESDFIDRPFGEETPRQSIDRIITSHIEGHARQITEARDAISG